ncbi:hypothetical protein IIA79_08240, partial [bacterium]|nr:hypothetical protein [bacterium]
GSAGVSPAIGSAAFRGGDSEDGGRDARPTQEPRRAWAISLACLALTFLQWPSVLAQESSSPERDPPAAAGVVVEGRTGGAPANVAEAPPNGVEAMPGSGEQDMDQIGQAAVFPGEPGEEEEAGAFFGGMEDIAEFLPGIAQDQPGFIPDILPEDLLLPLPSGAPAFETLIGPSRLPQGTVEDIIARQAARPERDLEANFARIVVPHGTIYGSTETKQFHIEGGLIIYYSDVTISADVGDIDEKNEVAILSGNVSVVDPKYSLAADGLRLYFEDKKFEARGFVQFKKIREAGVEADLSLPKKERLREHFASQQFELYCKTLYYDWDLKEMAALGSVRLSHPSFNGSMERIDYNDETKEYEISGNVVLEVSDYGWIFENKLIEEEDEPKVRSLTDGATKITCGRLVYSEETGIAQFYARPGGEVVFEQPTRSVRGAYIEVNDKTKDFYCEGTPQSKASYAQSDGKWLFDGGLISREEVSEDLIEALESGLTAEAGSITYNFDRKRLELRGQVSITAGASGSERSLEAEEIIQDETAKFFLMRGNVVIKPDAKSHVYAAQVYIDTDNDVFTFVGLVQGSIESEDIPTFGGEEEAGEEGFEAQAGIFRQVEEGSVQLGRGASAAGSRPELQINVAEGN